MRWLPFVAFVTLVSLAAWALADSGAKLDTRTTEVPLTCSLRADRGEYPLGESPAFHVRFKNHTNQPVFLVGCLDGSFTERRYPRMWYEVTAPDGQITRKKFPIGCKFQNVLREKDIVEVPGGREFDPFHKVDEYGFFGPGGLAWLFPESGEYRVRFVYSTDAAGVEAWQGSGTMKPATEQRLAKVPRTTLVSNPVTVRIRPVR